MTRLVVEDLEVSLDRRPVVKGLSFAAEDGEFVGLIGANGVGKSTLIRALTNLIAPSGGRILVDGTPIGALSRKALARTIAYLPQGQAMHWPLEVYHLVALGRLPHLSPFARPSAEDEAAIRRAMEQADVLQYAGRSADSLSGGERARVMLARALAVETPILLADEPAASLDPYHQLQVMELLQGISRRGRLVVAVLHDLPLAARFCDRLVLMSDGEALADGAPGEVLEPGNLGAAYQVGGYYGRHEAEDFVLPWRRLRLNGEGLDVVADQER